MSAKRTVRIGTRRSRLATRQAEAARDALSARFPEIAFEIVKISSHGDRDRTSSLGRMSMTGIFTRRLEEALRSGEVDLCAHSLKDLPTRLDPDVEVPAVLSRGDPRDALISKGAKTVAALPEGAVVATGSIRRRSQVLITRPDVTFEEIRGNVETRLEKLAESDWEATIMALAGLQRLGLESRVTAALELTEMVPAPAQGVIGLECRTEEATIRDLILQVNDEVTFAAAGAERALMRHLEGGCYVPIGAHAEVSGGRVRLQAIVASEDGRRSVRGHREGPMGDSTSVGIELAEELLADGAEEILSELRLRYRTS